MKSLAKERNDINEPKTSDEYINKICRKNEAIQKASMVTVIFAALTLEAFINNYGIEVYSRNRFDKYLDKLDFVSKWLILPKLNTGKELDTDRQAFQNLQNLCALRNKLVHPKTFKRRISEIKDNDWTTEKDAHNAIMTVEILVKELKKLDNKIDIAWLEQIKVLCR